MQSIDDANMIFSSPQCSWAVTCAESLALCCFVTHQSQYNLPSVAQLWPRLTIISMHFSSALATAIHYSRTTLHKNSWAALDISWRFRLNASGWNAVEIEEVKDKRATLGHNETRRASQRNEWMVDAASGTSAVVLLTLIQGFWFSSLLLAFPSVIYCWRH